MKINSASRATLGFLISVLMLFSGNNPLYSETSVIGGTDVSVTEQESRGLVQLSSGCSGVLLTNDQVLTAGHCIANHQNPDTVVAIANWGAATNRMRKGMAIYKFADFNSERGADLALIYLTSPFEVLGSATGFNTQLNLDESSAILNSTIRVFGVGYNEVPNLGYGTWRTADLTTSSVDERIYHFNSNANGQIIAPGDSGGPDFVGAKLTGIHSGIFFKCSDDSTKATCKATITQILSGFSVSIPAMKSAIQAVRATSWDPTRSTLWLDVFSDEIRETRYGWSADNNVNDIDWAQAFRSANEMCFNRGFFGGHFSGHNVLEHDLHGLVCSGPGAVWYDATSQEVESTAYGFTDTNLVHWAQANRAATWICENFRSGFTGGHFNGHQSLQADGSKRFGLICYSSGVKWFDVTIEQYASLGYDISDVNSTHWAYAMRAANDYCVSQGYVGGYMNGHQSGNLIGTICQGNPPNSSQVSVPTLSLNFTSGAPGSYFTLTGAGFTANSQEEMFANGNSLGKIMVDDKGQFNLILSTYFTEPGSYWLSTQNPSAPTQIDLNINGEVRPRENANTIEFDLALNKVISKLFLPLVSK